MSNKTKEPDRDKEIALKCQEPAAEVIKSFGRWIEAWREYRGLSLSEMARRSGWDAQFQNLLEKETRKKKNGDPPMPREETVRKIAEVLNVPERDALLAAGYAPPDLRYASYVNAPRRSPEGNFVLSCQPHAHTMPVVGQPELPGQQVPSHDATDMICTLQQKLEEVLGRLAEYDQRFAHLQSEQNNHFMPNQSNPASKPTPRQSKSKQV